MFPFARLVVAVGIFLGLQLSLSHGGAAALGDASIAEFVRDHGYVMALFNALAALAAFVVVTKVIERRTVAANGLGRRGAPAGVAKGFVVATAMISAVIGVMTLAGWYEIVGTSLSEPGAWAAVAGSLGIFLVVAVFEEVAFRGLLFRIVEEGLGSLPALALTSLFFGGLHLMNPNSTMLGALGVALAGVLLTAAYMLTRNLWLAIGLHWAWNFVQGSVFGVPVSGQEVPALIHEKVFGPELWTGGVFGPEAGLLAYVVSAVVTVVMLLLAARRGHFVTPPGWMRRAGGPLVAGAENETTNAPEPPSS
jgi:membrane protease YdiL (CAAX protease family)